MTRWFTTVHLCPPRQVLTTPPLLAQHKSPEHTCDLPPFPSYSIAPSSPNNPSTPLPFLNFFWNNSTLLLLGQFKNFQYGWEVVPRSRITVASCFWLKPSYCMKYLMSLYTLHQHVGRGTYSRWDCKDERLNILRWISHQGSKPIIEFWVDYGF